MTAPQTERLGLDGLHDVVLPDPVAWWPPAPGWIALAVVLAGAVTWATCEWWRRHRALSYRREAIARLRAIRAAVDEHDPHETLESAARVLKWTAMRAHSRAVAASLQGEAWARFLDDHSGRHPFPTEARRTLDAVLYAGAADIPPHQVASCIDAVELWIRAQGVPKPELGAAE